MDEVVNICRTALSAFVYLHFAHNARRKIRVLLKKIKNTVVLSDKICVNLYNLLTQQV